MADELIAKKKGDMVEGYRVLQEIGRGAASIVYLVQDPKSKQIWALKHVQKHGPKDQRFLDQAEQEYKISQAVNHPGVRKMTKIIKKGSLLNTRELYLVMELVDGLSAERYEFDSVDQLVDVYRVVAAGLAAMHDAGYVHADMKPHNIIVGADFDGNLTPKIIDLGQSCKIGTVKERIQGTPDYIAPEQVHRRQITPKTDIYNLGASIYFSLTGKNIPTAMGAKQDSLMGSLDDALIEKPTPVQELRPDLPERLAEIVMQSIEVNPDARPDSMHQVADKLDVVFGLMRAKAEQFAGDDED